MRTTSPARLPAIDALRGIALLWMTAFHFCFDLQYFGYLHTSFYENPVWTTQRSAIVTLFMFCAGLGQALAVHHGQTWRHFGRNWIAIASGAALVTVASYGAFPNSFIYFGILHGMAVMLVLARCSVPAGNWLWPLGAVALALPSLVAPLHAQWPAAELLNTPAWNWLGLISRKPITEDYAPLFPWLGVMLWGVASGRWLMAPNQAGLRHWLAARRSKPIGLLAGLGRHSLPYYLLHQPIMIGAVALTRW